MNNQITEAEKNKVIKSRTTIKVGGRVKYYKKVDSIDSLVETVLAARKKEIEHIIIGGGSNLIFSDMGFQGLVIENRSSNIEVQNNQIISDSGVFTEKLVRISSEFGLQGLEFLAGIPATVGGLVVNNAGAYGREIADLLVNVLIMDQSGKQVMTSPSELGFSYRESKLKGKTSGINFPIVLKAYFDLKKASHDNVARKIEDHKKIRAKSNPAGFSAGCIFKNPKINKIDFPDEWLDKVKNGRISAGFLLDMAGAKGMSVGHAYVPEEHANYIINKKRAKAAQVKALRDKMKKLVKDKYGITLENEVEFVGKFD